MRILTLSDWFPPNNPGGAQEVARRLSVGYRQAGNDVAIVTTHDPDLKCIVEYDGLPIYSIANKAGLNYLPKGYEAPEVTRKIEQFIVEFNPDVIHAHNVHSSLGWGWIDFAKKQNIKICMTFHDQMTISQGKLIPPSNARPGKAFKQSVLRELVRYKLRYIFGRQKKIIRQLQKLDLLTAVSQDLANHLTINGLPDMEVIWNGVDLSTTPVTKFSLEPTLLFIGRPTAEKGLDLLVRAVAKSQNEWK